MGEDASLDEFLDDDGDDGTTDGGASGGADGEADAGEGPTDGGAPDATGNPDTVADGEPPLAPDAVDPATTTHAHSPDGAACAACGATVTERWQDAAGMVCPDCKEW
jgi:hypothetical protein